MENLIENMKFVINSDPEKYEKFIQECSVNKKLVEKYLNKISEPRLEFVVIFCNYYGLNIDDLVYKNLAC